MLITFTGLKIALATAVGSLALGGAAAAATGSLPGQAHFDDQSSASSSSSPFDTASGTGATSSSATPSDSPTAQPSDTGSSSASSSPSADPSGTSSHGPDAQGPAAWGLCHAFGNKTWGNLNKQPTGTPNPAGRKPGNPSAAYANLVAAAAAHGLTVDQFCTVVLASHGAPPTVGATPSSSATPTASLKAHGHGHGNGHSHRQGKGKGHKH